MRFPPANGFAGSAVWQAAQAPAMASALPRARVSAEGSDCALAPLNAVHKISAARIACIMRRRPCTILSPVGASIARKGAGVRKVVSPRRPAATQTEKAAGVFGHEVANRERGTPLPRFV